MKTNTNFKSFTDGLAIFLAVLIAIYFLTGFIKTGSKSGGDLGFAEKIESLFDNATYRGYFHVFLLLILSAAVGIILRRLPFLSVLAASLPLFYELNMLTGKLLTKYPTGVILLTASHLAGAVAYAAMCDRQKTTRLSCPLAGAVVGMAGCGFSAYIALLCRRVAAYSDTLAQLHDSAVIVPNAVRPLPGAVGRIYSVFLSEGGAAARSLGTEYLESMGKTGVRVNFLTSVEGDEAGAYLGLCLVFLAASVLAFVQAGRRRPLLAFALSCLPVAVCVMRLIDEKLSTGGIVLLAAAVICALCFAPGITCPGGVDDAEETEAPEPSDPQAPDGDEVFYS